MFQLEAGDTSKVSRGETGPPPSLTAAIIREQISAANLLFDALSCTDRVRTSSRAVPEAKRGALLHNAA